MKQFPIIICAVLLLATVRLVNAEEKLKTSWLKNFKLTFDDGNTVEEFDPAQNATQSSESTSEDPTLKIQNNEKGTHAVGRTIIKPFFNAASYAVTGVSSRISKALNFVTHTTGLDTNTTFFSGTADKFKSHIKMIYPGTRWCGDGDKAKSDDDLGTFETTDKCCRAHDKCFDFIPAGATKYDLNNTGLFTRSHCTCDQDFYNCLKNSTDLIAAKIGFTYFSILGPQCFKEEDYVTGCILYSRGKCIEYRTDPSKGKLFQWFDSPMFIKYTL